jgi:hypothetical protein
VTPARAGYPRYPRKMNAQSHLLHELQGAATVWHCLNLLRPRVSHPLDPEVKRCMETLQLLLPSFGAYATRALPT